MKIFSGVFGLVILVLVLCFALSNPQDANVAMWPFAGTLQAPLYLICLAPLVFGLIFGGVGGWLASVPHRLRARRLNKELNVLNERINELQKTGVVHPAPVPPKRPFWGLGL